MSDTVTTIKDGDIFRWHYRNEDERRERGLRLYWCRSQIAIAKNGRLTDTYWGGSGDEWWPYEIALEALELRYLGNFNELESAPSYMSEYYDPADCVDISHGNSTAGNFYVRKGAKRSIVQMRQVVEQKIADQRMKISSAQRRLEELESTLRKINNGVNLEKIYI